HRAAGDRSRDDEHARISEVGLHGHEENGPDVLDDEDAQREPSGQDLQLELVAQELHDDQRRAQRDDDREIVEVELATARPVAEQPEEHEPQQRVDHELADAEHEHRPPQAPELPDVDLEADDEQQEDEADLRDDLDALGIGDESEAKARPQHDAARDVAEDQ